MIETEVRQLYYRSLSNFAAQPDVLALFKKDPKFNKVLATVPIQWANWEPKKEELPNFKHSHLRARFMTLTPEQLTTCGTGALHKWLFQIDILLLANLGEILAYQIVDLLGERFPVGHTEGKHKVVEPLDVVAPLISGGWYDVPVTIRIQSIT